MDLDDEDFINNIERRFREGKEWRYLFSSYGRVFPELKLYENKWNAQKRVISDRAFERSNSRREDSDSTEQSQDELSLQIPSAKIINQTAYYRVKRFIDTMKGFHAGNLDLTGRFAERYRSILPRWQEFSKDVAKMRQHAVLVYSAAGSFEDEDVPMVDLSGEIYPVRNFEVRPRSILKPFISKWRADVNLAMIFDSTDSTIEYIAQHPNPQFQKICLHDLPHELVLLVFEAGGEDVARRLGATGRYFREASLPYLHKSHSLTIPFALDKLTMGIPEFSSEEGRQKYLNQVAVSSGKKAMGEIEYLLSRQDIVRHLRRMIISSRLIPTYGWTGATNNSDLHRDILRPILNGIGDIIANTASLDTLSMMHLPLTYKVMDNIARLQCLKSIHLLSCGCSPQWPVPTNQSTSVVNATVMIRDIDVAEDPLRAIEFLGAIRFLCIDAEGCRQGEDVVPPVDLLDRFNPFQTVERAILTGVYNFVAPAFVSWIEHAALHGGLRLTHFKLSVRWGIDRDVLSSLLDALSSGPLQTFSLDGLWDCSPDTLREIGAKLSRLTSLSIQYRESDRQQKASAVNLSYPCHEYATQMAHFPNLKYFAWNAILNFDAVFPSDLTLIEDGFPESEWGSYNEDSMFEDGYHIALHFGSCSPTLKHFGFLANGRIHPLYRIQRGERLSVVEEAYSLLLDFEEEHNPRGFSWGGWRDGWEFK